MSGRADRDPVHGILLLDKPAGLTSNQALQKVKRLLRARKAGHTGALDPAATHLGRRRSRVGMARLRSWTRPSFT